jgi:prepilin-type N-terminal cleavage/methylation domain-containing protein
MNSRNTHRGVTLIEMIVVVAILAVVMGVFATLLGKNTALYKRMQVRQKVMLQSRVAMDVIQQRLRSGKARTLIITTPNSSNVPNSRVDFVLQTPLPSGATAYAIYLQNEKVYTLEYPDGQNPRPIAENVTGLMFTGDAYDPAVVGITLRQDVPWDASNTAQHTSTIILPNQMVHMVEAP